MAISGLPLYIGGAALDILEGTLYKSSKKRATTVGDRYRDHGNQVVIYKEKRCRGARTTRGPVRCPASANGFESSDPGPFGSQKKIDEATRIIEAVRTQWDHKV